MCYQELSTFCDKSGIILKSRGRSKNKVSVIQFALLLIYDSYKISVSLRLLQVQDDHKIFFSKIKNKI